MDKVKFAIIGVGNIGSMHTEYFSKNLVEGAELIAVCDTDPSKLQRVKDKYGDRFKLYDNDEAVMNDQNIDAVLIATPHYSHPTLGIEALNHGKHVLSEKPIGVYTKDVAEMNAVAAAHPELTFGIDYNQRTNPLYRKMRELIQSGEIGEFRRVNWIITNWYRSQSYYDSGTWRATWKGEGGGVLLNQDPHQLDLLQWLCGMPKRIMSFAYFGKRRNIEVEDEVTAYFEYPNGATGVFVTSVSETPGTNRLEIVGSAGKLVVENNKLSFWKVRTDEREFNKNYQGGFGEPEVWQVEIPVKFDDHDQHMKITQNFTNHIRNGEKLLAPGIEGINGLTISNAIHLSTWEKRWVELPIDADLFLKDLNEHITHSQDKKTKSVVLDTDATY
ncbi:Gfo/Idh/MocA family protein [Lapidilactobacillus bayanensis]|uniref:Gfo/Idh/MocA family protein n=1 Tax=Lapidilactobacillus bayanensis TaxID=2485998 RepID=UPI000F7B619E|nr:Gfo/Idh/MocA family oxidoreductase [Lapidilactobacillus bayanensis]